MHEYSISNAEIKKSDMFPLLVEAIDLAIRLPDYHQLSMHDLSESDASYLMKCHAFDEEGFYVVMSGLQKGESLALRVMRAYWDRIINHVGDDDEIRGYPTQQDT
jgi:hypothetical protein